MKRMIWSVVALLLLGALFILDVAFVSHEQRANASRTADSVVPLDMFNVTYEYNATAVSNATLYEDCYVALGYFDGVTVNGTTTFRNCGITQEKVFCYDKNGKIKCEVKR